MDDTTDVVSIQGVYITHAYRANRIANAYRAKVILQSGKGLQVTSFQQDAEKHEDMIFLGPAEECFSRFFHG